MIEIEPLEKIIALTLQSAYVKNNERAVSLLVIADAEHGKTEAIETVSQKLIKEKKVFYSNNLTAKYIERTLLRDIETGKIKHIVIPDILNTIERSRTSRKLFINFFKSMIEEGIIHIADAYGYFQARDSPVKCGLITSITKSCMNENWFEWRNIGFLSRLLPFSYKYDYLKVHKIFEKILIKDGKETRFKINETTETIEDYDKNYTDFDVIAQNIAKAIEGLGIRMKKMLIALARSNAKLESRKKVEKKDIEEIYRLANWINYNYNPL